MPEGQDPYGSFAFNQRIRKETLSSINFRRTRNMGGTWFSAQLPSASSSEAPTSTFFSSAPVQQQFIPSYQFVLSNPITHMDRVITPVLRSRIDYAKKTAQAINASQQDLPLTPKLPLVAQNNNSKVDQAGGLYSVAPSKADEVPTPVPTPVADEVVASLIHSKPKSGAEAITVDGRGAKPPLGIVAPSKRLMSAAVSRRIPQPAALNSVNFNVPPGRAASAGSRRSSGASSTDSEFAAKVASLELVLQHERESRLRVQHDLARLERLLEAKMKPQIK